nr:hypothetical protein [uncultured Duganella sp.]
MVGSPAYLKRAVVRLQQVDLLKHDCILYRYPQTGKLDMWPWDGVPHELPGLQNALI